MHVDPAMPVITGIVFGVLIIGLIVRWLRQPHVIVYLLAGVVLGPSGLALVDDVPMLDRIGSIGVLLLLFFVGMEVSVARLAKLWRVALIGTAVQIAVSVGLTFVLGRFLGWSLARIVLLGFVISLSSTAVVLKLLQDRGELEGRAGQDALAILLAQDLAVVPMLIVLNLFSGHRPTAIEIGMQLAGTALLAGLVIWTARRKVRVPAAGAVREDPEIRIFGGFAACFGLALVSGLLGLSAALGAFVAGMVVAAVDEAHWIHEHLEPFRIVLVALFFVSVGMAVDLEFVAQRWWIVLLLAAAAMVTNTLVNAFALRSAGGTWKASLYTAAILGQIGEFSFLLAAAGKQEAVITEDGYRLTVAVIFTTLAASPFWILPFARWAKAGEPAVADGL